MADQCNLNVASASEIYGFKPEIWTIYGVTFALPVYPFGDSIGLLSIPQNVGFARSGSPYHPRYSFAPIR
jgi:hypothetical protein